MLTVANRNWIKFFLFIFVFSLFIETYENTAEAARRGRGRAFGRRAARGGGGRRVRQARGRGNRNRAVARNRRNNNDQFGLDLQPVNLFSNLNVDPSGDLQRLALFNNLAFNRNGQLFELNNGNIFDARQPLVLSNGQVLGGAFGALSPETLQQVQLLNDSGNFNLLRR